MKKTALYLVLALIVAMMGTAPALAQDVTVQTEAEVTGVGQGPVVEAIWFRDGLLANWQVDPNLVPPMLSIPPNTFEPTPGIGAATEICTLAVLSDPNGIGDLVQAWIRVFHPDGSIKYSQIHMVLVADPTAALNFAVVSGQMTQAQADELFDAIDKNTARLYRACFDYHTHQPSGTYTVRVTGQDQMGNVGWAEGQFFIQPVIVLAADFDTVDFGSILPNTPKWVAGNDVFEPPSSTTPTLWNQGNQNAALVVRNSVMLGAEYAKPIEEFDVQFVGVTRVYPAEQDVCLPGPLLPCTPTQIDFSVHPPTTLPVDTYSGSIIIDAYPEGHCI